MTFKESHVQYLLKSIFLSNIKFTETSNMDEKQQNPIQNDIDEQKIFIEIDY